MTKIFNKDSIIPIEEGYVVVDERKTNDNDLGLLKFDHYNTIQKIDEIHLKVFQSTGLLLTKVIIASIGKRIEGVPFIEEVDELEELISELPIDWMGTGSVKSAEAEEKAWRKKWNAYKAAQSKFQGKIISITIEMLDNQWVAKKIIYEK